MALGALPRLALLALVPSLMLAKPLAWALARPQEAVPLPALGANVIWNLSTNTLVALTLVAATILRS